jgi:hypothetical protein
MALTPVFIGACANYPIVPNRFHLIPYISIYVSSYKSQARLTPLSLPLSLQKIEFQSDGKLSAFCAVQNSSGGDRAIAGGQLP